MEKIKRLKKTFKKENIDGYIIPKNDEFFGEYVLEHKDRLKFISEFSGSYGFAVILRKKNYLFVDGRYTLQARRQCGKIFNIVTFPNQMPKDIFKNRKLTLGFDPNILTNKFLKDFFNIKSLKFIPFNENLVDKIWNRRIKKKKQRKFYILPQNAGNESYKFKIKKVISFLNKASIDYQFVSSSENIAWLLNIRGNDSKYSPIPNSYILVDKYKNIKLFCDLGKITSDFKKFFNEIQFLEINSIRKILNKIQNKSFAIDKNTCSIYFENLFLKDNKIINTHDPIYNFKAIKTKREIDQIKKAHLYDGIALTKYLFWLRNNFEKKKITEISASKKLYEFRKKNSSFKFSSFPTISGSGPNGAIIHYKATNDTNRVLHKGDIYLVDSGGQYEFGTTDVTRTVSLKNSNLRIKNIFTRVLKGHIAVASFKLNSKTSGSEIDFVARKYLKPIGLNYSHGTGHGVGYFLNVHEGPQAISKNNKVNFKEGMILSNEPGYYEKDKFGIRIENLIYVKKLNNRNCFENLTLAPIDKDLINKSLLNKKEKDWLNKYHRRVFKSLKDAMNKLEILELKKACSAI